MTQQKATLGVPGNKKHSIEIRVFGDIYARCHDMYGWSAADARKAGSMVSAIIQEQQRRKRRTTRAEA